MCRVLCAVYYVPCKFGHMNKQPEINGAGKASASNLVVTHALYRAACVAGVIFHQQFPDMSKTFASIKSRVALSLRKKSLFSAHDALLIVCPFLFSQQDNNNTRKYQSSSPGGATAMDNMKFCFEPQISDIMRINGWDDSGKGEPQNKNNYTKIFKIFKNRIFFLNFLNFFFCLERW